MKLYWASWSDFFAMGGYGPYVWGSFGVAVVVIAAELWSLRQRRKGLTSETEP
jgi:heme exporter protein D